MKSKRSTYVPDELELAHRQAAQTPIARHQGDDGDGFAIFLDEEDIELLTRSETLPPSANPFVSDKGMVGAGLLDQLVPERLQIQKCRVVRDGFDGPCGLGAPGRCGRRNGVVHHQFRCTRNGDKFGADILIQSGCI